MRVWNKYAVVIDGEEKYLVMAKWRPNEDESKNKNKLSERNEIYRDYLKSYINNTKSILSLGSGYCELESYLQRNGLTITATDINQSIIDGVKKTSPNLYYEYYDPVKKPYNKTYDIIIAFSFLYTFCEDELVLLIKNINKSLKNDGKFIVDIGGGENNFITWLLDLIQKIEILMYYLYSKILGQKVEIVKKGNGYRSTNYEIISLFKKNGFNLERIDYFDTLSELGKRTIIGKFLSRSNLVKKFFCKIGNFCPYIRLIVFTK